MVQQKRTTAEFSEGANMAVKFGGDATPEQEPEQEQVAKKVTAEKYGPKNPHPDKGIYLKVPLDSVELESTAYIGVASTGQLGITNIKFSFPLDLGEGDVMVTYHAGWGNLTIERDASFIKANNLLGKKSGLKVDEIPDYQIDSKGNSNVQELLGPIKSKE